MREAPQRAIRAGQAFVHAGAGNDSTYGRAGHDHMVSEDGDDTLFGGDVNGDGVADFLIRIDGVHTLGAGDFIL